MTRFDAGRPRCPERGPRTTWEALEEILPDGSGRCLDVGCGQGRHRRIIEGAGYQWVGLDRSPSEGVTVGDAHRLPFADGTFSLAVMWLSLQYFERPWQALSEVRRVLRPGGARLAPLEP